MTKQEVYIANNGTMRHRCNNQKARKRKRVLTRLNCKETQETQVHK